MTAFAGAPRPVVLGHRGGRGEGWPPENTLASFERARREGAFGVELDVRRCASGEVVVLHDPTLARVTDHLDARAVANVAWSELAKVRLGAGGERLPRLADVLDWASAAGMAVNVEVKHDVPDRTALVRAVARELSTRVPLILSSFDPRLLLALRVLCPRVPAALLTDPGERAAALLHALARPPFFGGLHVGRTDAWPARITRWRARGLFVGVWTVNDPGEARVLATAGADVLITDAPALLVQALASR